MTSDASLPLQLFSNNSVRLCDPRKRAYYINNVKKCEEMMECQTSFRQLLEALCEHVDARIRGWKDDEEEEATRIARVSKRPREEDTKYDLEHMMNRMYRHYDAVSEAITKVMTRTCLERPGSQEYSKVFQKYAPVQAAKV